MPRKSKRERSANEAEEAAWWEANEEAVAERFEKALEQRSVGGGCTLVLTGDQTVTKVRLGSRDVVRAQKQAAANGVGFHTYLKAIIHNRLRAAESMQ
jgi:predicted DNA binding CopG/RHH family protein